jgi:hypothetical protein
MQAHALDRYLANCLARRSTKSLTPETSLYPALEDLLASAGGGLKPRVHCFMSLKSFDGNMPDGGLFTGDQLLKGELPKQLSSPPSRGVIECKPPTDDVLAVADTKQISRYYNRFNQVLVTNYREFLLVGRSPNGKPERLEYYRLADSADAFWELCANRKAAVAEHGDRLLDFLKRCLRRPAPLAEPKDVAWFLASYAREARYRIEANPNRPKLEAVRKALEDSLGLHVKDAEGEHFFQSTLVQTLFYGVFAAWVLWHRQGEIESFDWEKASKYLHVPIIRKLFRELTDPQDLEELHLNEIMAWGAAALNRVDRDKFFAKFKDAEAVQYFYEPFLEAFDPELRKQLGVWYTPPEIVKYMVGRVHQVLIEEFDRPDGLADPGVVVLDPCCGTGAYLVEVLNTVAAVLKEKGEDALLAGHVKQAATDRVFGFEILPAPFVIAHLQLGLLLQTLGAPLVEKKHERAKVFLTNALTGWEPPKGPKKSLPGVEWEEERAAADAVKQTTPILVVIGNPPYNGFAGLPADEDKGLVDAYRTTKAAPKPEGQGLNDLYIRFYRIAERCITQRGKQHGIVCYISNYSWLDGRSHTGLRERFLDEFDQVWIDCLNGDKYKTGKLTPEGKPDPSVFSTPSNREGIQVGTAIATLVRTPKHDGPATVRYRDFWGESKREDLLASGQEFSPRKYKKATPIPALGLAFRPMQTEENYTAWPLLTALFPTGFPGVKTSRDEGLVEIDREELERRMASYFDRGISHRQMRDVSPRLMEDAARFDAEGVRTLLRGRLLQPGTVVTFLYRPFDIRWLHWENSELLDRPRPEYFPHVMRGNVWLTACQQNRKGFDPPIACSALAAMHIIERTAILLPMLLRSVSGDVDVSHRIGEFNANITDEALAYLNSIGSIKDAPHLFHHAIAVMHAPQYAKQNASALRQDWPRIPLPAVRGREALVASAALGRRIAALLDPETPVPGVTAGKLTAAMKTIAVPTKVGGGSLDGPSLEVTARWGITGKGGVTMPSTGKVTARAFSKDEEAALEGAAPFLGPDTLDVHLNDSAFWKNVPRAVWEYHLGGYQVIKKWLSYREKAILGRGLKIEEVAHVRDTARRIAALILLGPELDVNYASIHVNGHTWPART